MTASVASTRDSATASGAILVVNAGSSSLKYSLFAREGGIVEGGTPGDATPLALREVGIIDNLLGEAKFSARDAGGATLATQAFAKGAFASADASFDFLLQRIERLGVSLYAVGHRVVHGGTRYAAPIRVTPEVLAALEALTPLAPLHQPYNVAPIRVLAGRHPSLPQVACFDTAFHQTAPAIAQAFALPPPFPGEGVRRYGFHGLSYEYIAERLREVDRRTAAGRVIVLHLGNGASACAMIDGRSVASTMGMTALDGLMMGTRAGSLDPGVLLYLMREHGMDAAALETLLYKRSGLLGVSGVASDMRALLASDDERARFAVELFCYRATREIGSLAAAIGGADALVFTAGIGEHAPPVRAKIVETLAWLGFAIEADTNAGNALSIAAQGSKPVYVIPTNEELMIARHTRDCVTAM